MNFCEKCGKKARDSAIFCSGCGSELYAAEHTSELLSNLRKRNSRRKTILAISAALLSGTLVFSAINFQSIASNVNEIVNPVPEKVFVQLSKPAANQGWSQFAHIEAQIKSNKSNSYFAVLEIKSRGKWESFRQLRVELTQDSLFEQDVFFGRTDLTPGKRELRVKMKRVTDSQEVVAISKSMKINILKVPQGMQIADDSNNTIVWRFAKDSEEPQYCAKYNRCFFLKVASTKRCTIKATNGSQGQSGKVVSINNASKSSIGSVPAYTPKKSYLIEVPSNKVSVSPDISARCFALSSGSNQGSTPTPTKKPSLPTENPACSRIAEDIEETVFSIWHFDNFTQYDAPDYMYGNLADYRREFDLFQCDVPNSWSYSQYSRLRNW